MGLDPKSLNAIRLVKDRTSGSSRALAGPITPKYITLALPKVGRHQAWIDHVVERVLCEIISAYRVSGNKAKPFWNGPAYRIDRNELSKRLSCRLRDISTALQFLEKNGFLHLVHKCRYKRGEPNGTMVYAIPDVDAIDKALIEAEASVTSYLSKLEEAETAEEVTIADHNKVPEFDTQPVGHGHSTRAKSGSQDGKECPQSLNVPLTARNDDVEQGGREVAPSQKGSTLKKPEQSHFASALSEGGGAAAFAGSTAPDAHASTSDSTSGPSSPAQEPDPVHMEAKVNRFCYFWIEGAARSGRLAALAIEKRERAALQAFFMKNPTRSVGWLAAVAITAWKAGNRVKKRDSFDPAWACRHATDIQSFLRHVSKIFTELGTNGFKVNAYRNLREWFTDSELTKQTFNVNSYLGYLWPEDCWENNPDAPYHYLEYGLQMPSEVAAAQNERKNGNQSDDPE